MRGRGGGGPRPQVPHRAQDRVQEPARAAVPVITVPINIYHYYYPDIYCLCIYLRLNVISFDLYLFVLIVSTATYLPNTIGSYPSCNHGSSSVSRCTGAKYCLSSAQSALTTHASCAAPPRLHSVSPALQESFLLPGAPQQQWGGG